MKTHTIKFENKCNIIATGVVCGDKERNGPLKPYLMKFINEDSESEKTYEKAERQLLIKALKNALTHADLKKDDINAIVSGDLLNQIISSTFAAREFPCAHVGLYSACATMAESLLVGSMLINQKSFQNVICATSSHFSSVERQYRYPLELGTQRTPTSQWTVTGAGAAILSNVGQGPRIVSGTFGQVVDFGVNDVNNMGAAMAPAAANTIEKHLNDLSIDIDYYDMVFTGDLGFLGKDILKDLTAEKGIKLDKNYDDCGAMIYHDNKKHFQGGSGAGCSAIVFNSYIYENLKTGKLNKVLFLATGALLSKLTAFQGETIPCICHGVGIENNDKSPKKPLVRNSGTDTKKTKKEVSKK